MSDPMLQKARAVVRMADGVRAPVRLSPAPDPPPDSVDIDIHGTFLVGVCAPPRPRYETSGIPAPVDPDRPFRLRQASSLFFIPIPAFRAAYPSCSAGP